MGNGLKPDMDIGPLIDTKAKNSVLESIDNAVKQGAKIALGGQVEQGLFVQPTVLTDVTQEMDITQAEIFGPVAPVIRFSDDQELLDKANDTIYGLASYFYTENIKRAFHIAEQLEYGMVGINEGLISNEVAPFGGVKQSGFGREGAKQGIDEYLNLKYLCFGGM